MREGGEEGEEETDGTVQTNNEENKCSLQIIIQPQSAGSTWPTMEKHRAGDEMFPDQGLSSSHNSQRATGHRCNVRADFHLSQMFTAE